MHFAYFSPTHFISVVWDAAPRYSLGLKPWVHLLIVLINLMSSFASWFNCCEGLTNSCSLDLKYLRIGLDVGVRLALVVLHKRTRYIRIEISFPWTLTQTSLQWLCHRELTYKFIAEKSFQFNYLFKYNCQACYSSPLFHHFHDKINHWHFVSLTQGVCRQLILQGKWNINIKKL